MKKKWSVCIAVILFLGCFVLSGITGSATLKDVPASATFSYPELLYSVSSAPAVLLTLVVIFALISLLSYLIGQRSAGFLFLCFSVVLYIICTILIVRDTDNYIIFNELTAKFKASGIKSVKKRDVHTLVTANPYCFMTPVIGLGALLLGRPSMKDKRSINTLKREIGPFLFIGPHLILFLLFFLVPTIYGIYAAFTKWDIFGTPEFIGLNNFKVILFDSNNIYYRQLRNGLWNTVKFVIYAVPGCIVIPLLLALALQVKARGSKFFQSIYYLPALMSASSVMMAWEFFFKKTYGMLNNLFGSTVNWFDPPYSWIMIVIITIWWCTGTNMVIYQSALAGIPQDHYEAASIDGANAWQKFWHITIPGMRYPLAYTITTSVVGQFNVYAQVDILLGYTNSEANAVLMMYIRDTAFKQQIAGIASAMALILGLCIAIATSMQVRVMSEKD